jgi:sulfite exporter TauE/SafE
MCGGFVLALNRPGRPLWSRMAAPGALLLGKACTYVLLGAVAGIAGGAAVRSGWFGSAQAVLAVVAGILMVVAGLQVAGVLRELPVGSWFGPDSPYGRAVASVANARGPAAPFAMGALVGLLPCPLVYAFLAAALAAGGLLEAMGTMATLGLASAPALVLVALVGAAVSPVARRRIVRVAGVVVVALGVVTAMRGLAPDVLHRWFSVALA